MRILFSTLSLGLLILGFGSACSTANRVSQLEESVQAYATALRRQDSQMAVQFVQPELRNEFFEGMRGLSRYNFSNVQVSYVSPTEKLDNALVTLAIEYFSPTGMQVYQTERFLTWNYDEKQKRWFLKENHPLGQTTSQTLDSFRP
jgi:hypothetical protein